jgi:hypothetical protein
MTNSSLLLELIKQKGFTVTDFAAAIGLTRQGFHKKLKNKSEFKQTEIALTTKVLKLTREQEAKIFFALDVDK